MPAIRLLMMPALLWMYLGIASAFSASAQSYPDIVQSHQIIAPGIGGLPYYKETNTRLGQSIAPLGDVNGDGWTDIAVGEPLSEDNGIIHRGAVWILSLRPDGTVVQSTRITGETPALAAHLNPQDVFGEAIANVGDLDQNGYDDLVVSATWDDEAGEDSGALYTLFMGASGSVLSAVKQTGASPGFAAATILPLYMGRELAAIGDVDQDGVTDIAISSLFNLAPNVWEHRIWIAFLQVDGTVKSFVQIGPGESGFMGTSDGLDNFGSALSAVGDLNLDGVPDLAIGASNDDDGGRNRGAVWILFLKENGTVTAEQKISALSGGFNGVLDDLDYFGRELANLGDVDQQGRPELAVSAQENDGGEEEGGAIWILSLNADGTVHQARKISALEGGYTGEIPADDGFGYGLAGPGDINGDGVRDLITSSIGGQSFSRPDLYKVSVTFLENVPTSPAPEGALLAEVAAFPGLYEGTADWVDYDADGDLDLLLTGNTGDAPYTRFHRYEYGSVFTEIDAGFIEVDFSATAWDDMDNDGDPDLALTGRDQDEGHVSRIYRNDDGHFVDINAPLPGVLAGAVDWGDYDNDLDPDLLICGREASLVTTCDIYENDGSVFSAVQAGLIGIRRGTAEWVDYDADGDQDIFLTGRDDAGAKRAILYENQEGIFIDSGFSFTGVDLSATYWADVTEGPLPDLVLMGQTGSGVIHQLYKNDPYLGDRFELQELVRDTGEFGAFAFTAIGFLVTGRDEAGEPFSSLYYAPHGTTLLDPILTLPGVYKSAAAVGDYNGDTHPDVLLMGQDENDLPITRLYQILKEPEPQLKDQTTISLHAHRDGDGLFFAAGDYFPSCPGCTDLEDASVNLQIGTSPGGDDVLTTTTLPDGRPLLTGPGNMGDTGRKKVNGLADGTYYWRAQKREPFEPIQLFDDEQSFTIGPNRFERMPISSLPAHSGNWFTADIDNDGDFDLISLGEHPVTNESYIGSFLASTRVFKNENGVFSEEETVLADVRKEYFPFSTSVEFADFDHDNDLDLYLVGIDDLEQRVAKLYVNQDGTYAEMPNAPEGLTDFVVNGGFGDWDNDGDKDLILARSHPRLLTNIAGSFSEPVEIEGPYYFPYAREMIFLDVDHDYDLDILLTGTDSEVWKAGQTQLYKRHGNELLYDHHISTLSGSIAVSDYDFDGDLDLLAGGDNCVGCDASYNLYHADLSTFTDSTFENTYRIQSDIRSGQLSWVDYDNDGDPDGLFPREYDSPLHDFVDGRPSNRLDALTGARIDDVLWIDLDDDGDLDLLVSGLKEGDSVPYTDLYENVYNVPNTPPLPPAGLGVTVDELFNNVTFSWGQGSDAETPPQSLTYNLRIGTTPGGSEIMSAEALADGTLLQHTTGNVKLMQSWMLKEMPAGTYYWTVQSIDQGLMGSAFAEEQELILTDPTIPVELARFVGVQEGDRVVLSWETASELNNAGFEIQRAVANGGFSQLDFVEGHGTTDLVQAYSFVDEAAASLNVQNLRYRLKQIDFDGTVAYSQVVEVELDLPSVAQLLPNFPDPFNPTTTIQYNIPVGSEVDLRVYDMLGREVMTLVDGYKEAGRYKISVDAGTLPSGTYLYRLVAGQYVLTETMTLMK